MIDQTTKNKLIQELEKSGNVYLSCLKIGVNKATYYRWLKEDKIFSKKALRAIRSGRENNCDIAEHSVMILVKEKNLKAAQYILGHNSPRYKPTMSSSKVFLEHKRSIVEKNKTNEMITNGENYKGGRDDVTLYKHKTYQEKLERIKEIKVRYEKLGGIPLKADGSKITDDELIEYNRYIEEWYIKRGKILRMKNSIIDFVSFDKNKTTDTEDLNPAKLNNSRDNNT